jgi:hypothetical protein
MNERPEFDAMLRGWLAAEAPRSLPPDLLAPVLDVSRGSRPLPTWRAMLTVPPLRTRSVVLVGSPVGRFGVAATLMLLLVLVLAAALVVGAALLLQREPPPTPSAARGCPSTLADGQVAEVSLSREGLAGPNDSDPPAGVVLRLYDDGLLITSGYGRTQRQVEAGESGMTARRLSPSGMALLTGAIEQGAFGAGCNDRYVDRPTVTVTLRSADGGVAGARWGNEHFVRRMTPAELAVVTGLESSLLDLDAWLPADAWIDATERAYAPQRWELNVQQSDIESLGRGEVDPRVGTDGMTLPDGRSLLELGEPYLQPAQGDGGPPEVRGRCAVVDSAEAESIRQAFKAGGLPVYNQHWWLRDAAVRINPLRPDQDGCLQLLGREEGPQPTPTATATVGDLGAIDPCSHFSPTIIEAAQAQRGPAPGPLPESLWDEWLSPLGPEYRTCRYASDEPDRSWAAVTVDSRTAPTSTDRARELVHALFGDEAAEIDAGGRRAWTNGCQGGDLRACTPAIAISDEPYFVVVLVQDPFSIEPPDGIDSWARTLAEAIELPN